MANFNPFKNMKIPKPKGSGKKLPSGKVPVNYVKNLGKSVGLASLDVFKDLNPNLTSLIEDNVTYAKTKFEQVKELTDLSSGVKESKYIKDAKNIFTNAVRELKSGEIYTKEKQNQMMTSMGESLGIDMGALDEMDRLLSDDFSFDDESSSSSGYDSNDLFDENESSASSKPTQKIVNLRTITNNTIITDSRQQKATNSIMITQTTALLQAQQASTSAIINSLGAIAKFQQENTLNFYQDVSDKLSKIGEGIEKMSSIYAYQYQEDYHSQQFELLSNVLMGGLSVETYIENIKKRNGNAEMAGDMVKMIPAMLKGISENPLGMALKGGIKALIPSKIKDAMASFDNNLGKLPANLQFMFQKWSNDKSGGAKGWLKNILGDNLGVLEKNKKNPNNFSGYEKGAVAWNGKADRAVTLVIPSLLSKILKAVSHDNKELVYDYEKGQFSNTKEIEREYKDSQQRALDMNLGDTVNKIYDEFYKEIRNQFTGVLPKSKMTEKTKNKTDEAKRVLEIMAINGTDSLEGIEIKDKDVKKFLSEYLNNSRTGWSVRDAIARANNDRQNAIDSGSKNLAYQWANDDNFEQREAIRKEEEKERKKALEKAKKQREKNIENNIRKKLGLKVSVNPEDYDYLTEGDENGLEAGINALNIIMTSGVLGGSKKIDKDLTKSAINKDNKYTDFKERNKEIVKNLKESGNELKSTIKGSIEEIGEKITEAFRDAIGSDGTVEHHAEGGQITSPTITTLGEDGDEMVIPLNENRRGRAKQLLNKASNIIRHPIQSAKNFITKPFKGIISKVKGVAKYAKDVKDIPTSLASINGTLTALYMAYCKINKLKFTDPNSSNNEGKAEEKEGKKGFFERIKGKVGNLKDKAFSGLSTMLGFGEKALNFAGTNLAKTGGKVGKFLGKASNKVGGLGKKAFGMVSKGAKGIKEAYDNREKGKFTNTAKNAINKTGHLIKSGVDFGGKVIGDVYDDVKRFGGGVKGLALTGAKHALNGAKKLGGFIKEKIQTRFFSKDPKAKKFKQIHGMYIVGGALDKINNVITVKKATKKDLNANYNKEKGNIDKDDNENKTGDELREDSKERSARLRERFDAFLEKTMQPIKDKINGIKEKAGNFIKEKTVGKVKSAIQMKRYGTTDPEEIARKKREKSEERINKMREKFAQLRENMRNKETMRQILVEKKDHAKQLIRNAVEKFKGTKLREKLKMIAEKASILKDKIWDNVVRAVKGGIDIAGRGIKALANALSGIPGVGPALAIAAGVGGTALLGVGIAALIKKFSKNKGDKAPSGGFKFDASKVGGAKGADKEKKKQEKKQKKEELKQKIKEKFEEKKEKAIGIAKTAFALSPIGIMARILGKKKKKDGEIDEVNKDESSANKSNDENEERFNSATMTIAEVRKKKMIPVWVMGSNVSFSTNKFTSDADIAKKESEDRKELEEQKKDKKERLTFKDKLGAFLGKAWDFFDGIFGFFSGSGSNTSTYGNVSGSSNSGTSTGVGNTNSNGSGMNVNSNGGYVTTTGNDIKARVYQFFKNKGLNDAQVAGIMGNIEEESRFDPNVIEKGSGKGFGLLQFTDYAPGKGWRTILENTAKEQNADPGDLDFQLNFIWDKMINDPYERSMLEKHGFFTAKTPYEAAKAFTALERYSNWQTDMKELGERTGAAENYMNQIISGAYSGATASSNGNNNSSTANQSGSNINTSYNTGKGDGSSSSSNNSSSSAVNQAYEAFRNAGNSVLGKLTYSQSGARNPDAGSADCSSFYSWALMKSGVNSVPMGSNTESILNNDAGSIVLDNRNIIGESGQGLVSGAIPENQLQIGDALLYSRPTSGFTSGRPYRIGHVEAYFGDGKRIGHGSGLGPKITDLQKDSQRLIMVKRFINPETATGNVSMGATGNVTNGTSSSSGSTNASGNNPFQSYMNKINPSSTTAKYKSKNKLNGTHGKKKSEQNKSGYTSLASSINDNSWTPSDKIKDGIKNTGGVSNITPSSGWSNNVESWNSKDTTTNTGNNSTIEDHITKNPDNLDVIYNPKVPTVIPKPVTPTNPNKPTDTGGDSNSTIINNPNNLNCNFKEEYYKGLLDAINNVKNNTGETVNVLKEILKALTSNTSSTVNENLFSDFDSDILAISKGI